MLFSGFCASPVLLLCGKIGLLDCLGSYISIASSSAP